MNDEAIEWLLKQIEKDRRAADLVLRPYGDAASTNDAEWWTDERGWFQMGLSSDETPLIMRFTPQRVLAECESKRMLIHEYLEQGKRIGQYQSGGYDGRKSDMEFGRSLGYETAIRFLLKAYREYAGFREEWVA